MAFKYDLRASVSHSTLCHVAILASLAIAAVAPSKAAAAEAAATEASKTADAKVLSPINVDAVAEEESFKIDDSANQKFTAPLLDTPRSVTVIPEAVIEATGATSLADALRTVPGITMGMGEGQNPFGDRPFIRGYDSSSGIFIDGIRDTGSQSRDMFDVEQVEVVKGPGGVYGGRGAPGGSVNIITKRATQENFQQGSITGGTNDLVRTTVDVNQMLDDSVGFRLNGMWQNADVAGRDAVFDDRWGIAPTITFGLGTPTRVTFDFYHYQSSGLTDYGHPYDLTTGGPVNVDRDFYYGLTDRDFRKTQADIGTIAFEHDFNANWSASNTTRLSRSENDYISTNPDDSAGNVAKGYVWRSSKSRDAVTKEFINQTNLAGKFNTGFLKHTVALGFEAGQEEIVNSPYTIIQQAQTINNAGKSNQYTSNSRVCNTVSLATFDCTYLYAPNPGDPWSGQVVRSPAVTTTTIDTWSLYAFDTVELTPQWLVNLGLRFDDYKTNANTPTYKSIVGSGTGATTVLAGSTIAEVNLDSDSSFLSYQAGVVYKPVENASVYVNYATSSVPPGVTGGDGNENLNATNQILDPEEIENYELGAKWDVFGNRLSITSAIFRTDKDKTRIEVAPSVFEQSGKSRVQGIEFGISGSITPEWNAFGGYTYLDSELVDDGTATNDGKLLPGAPKNAFSLFTTYNILQDVTVGGGAYYVDKVYGNAANTRWVPSYWRFDAMASYQVTKNVDLQLNVQNLLDKTYYDRAYSVHMVSVAPGRSATLALNVKF